MYVFFSIGLFIDKPQISAAFVKTGLTWESKSFQKMDKLFEFSFLSALFILVENYTPRYL